MAFFIDEWLGNHVVQLVMIVAIDGMAERRYSSGKMNHCCRRDAEFTVTMHAQPYPKGLSDRRHLLVRAEAAPIVNVSQDHIHAAHFDARRKLFIAYQAHIGCQGNTADRLSHLAHTFQTRCWIFQVFEIDAFRVQPPCHTYGGLDRPSSIGIPTQWTLGKAFAQQTYGSQLLIGWK